MLPLVPAFLRLFGDLRNLLSRCRTFIKPPTKPSYSQIMAEQVSLFYTHKLTSIQFKAEGGKAFTAKDFPRAIELYTQVNLPPLEKATANVTKRQSNLILQIMFFIPIVQLVMLH